MRQAEERLNQLPLLTSVVVRYGVAYDACHDVGEALLAAYGFRTTNGPGQHEALGRYLRAVFDKPPAEKAAREFDRLRRARSQDRYEAKPVGAAATEKAEQVARTLFDAALARGLRQRANSALAYVTVAMHAGYRRAHVGRLQDLSRPLLRLAERRTVVPELSSEAIYPEQIASGQGLQPLLSDGQAEGVARESRRCGVTKTTTDLGGRQHLPILGDRVVVSTSILVADLLLARSAIVYTLIHNLEVGRDCDEGRHP